MRKIATIFLVLLCMPMSGVFAQGAPDAAELTSLLNEFLAGASRNDVSIHERFWAEDLIYTGSGGRRVGKADILSDMRSAPAPKPSDTTTIYTAEDVQIQQYGDSAIVAFRLVGTTKSGDRTDVANYLNTGTFLRRGGKWQAVAWQATRMPRPEDASKMEAAEADNALHAAMLKGDTKALGDMLDETFAWTLSTGEKRNRQQVLDELGSGKLKYSKMESTGAEVSLYGDTAIVRGTTIRQRSTVPGSETGDAAPFTAFYTLTLVRKDGAWKAVAMHSSRK
jgi:hypothetical protein